MKNVLKWIGAILLLMMFVGLTYAVTRIDVQPIGPEGTSVGLAGLNQKAFEIRGIDKIGSGEYEFNKTFYDLTELIGVVALAVCACFALLGIFQLLKRKNLRQVDRTIYCLGGLYLAVIALYFLFEKLAINYRPLLVPGEAALEPSYPSSHTMLLTAVMGSTALVLKEYVRSGPVRILLQVLCIVLIIATEAMRLLSGVHWMTDVAAGLLLGGALVLLFAAVRGDPGKTAR